MGGQAINLEEYVTEFAEEKPFFDNKDISKEAAEAAPVEKKTEEKAE